MTSKEKAIEILKQLDIYKPYIDGFREEDKVCYREEGAKVYVRYFLTHTRKQAFNAMRSYIRYPPTARDGDRELVNPKWKVIPVSEKETKRGIWRKCPF